MFHEGEVTLTRFNFLIDFEVIGLGLKLLVIPLHSGSDVLQFRRKELILLWTPLSNHLIPYSCLPIYIAFYCKQMVQTVQYFKLSSFDLINLKTCIKKSWSLDGEYEETP